MKKVAVMISIVGQVFQFIMFFHFDFYFLKELEYCALENWHSVDDNYIWAWIEFKLVLTATITLKKKTFPGLLLNRNSPSTSPLSVFFLDRFNFEKIQSGSSGGYGSWFLIRCQTHTVLGLFDFLFHFLICRTAEGSLWVTRHPLVFYRAVHTIYRHRQSIFIQFWFFFLLQRRIRQRADRVYKYK